LIEAIHAGGQSGGDSGGLAAAVKLDLRTGGWAPKGWRTESGPAPFLAQLGLKEHSSWEYPPRTRLNVAETDGTFIFGQPTSPGCRLTRNLAGELGKPLLIHPWQAGDPEPQAEEIARFRVWVRENEIRVLNVAGNRESKNPGITVACYSFLLAALTPS
jgi:hypothetical protein